MTDQDLIDFYNASKDKKALVIIDDFPQISLTLGELLRLVKLING